MRLICPRCGAQYEVDDVVIPAAGRDVQCSGCGQTWFQPSRQMLDAAEDPAADPAPVFDDESLPGAPQDPVVTSGIAADPEPEAWPEPRPEDWPDIDPAPEDAASEPAPPAIADDAVPRGGVSEATNAETGALALEGLDWAVPPQTDTEPEPADLDLTGVETDVTQAIAELMRAHPPAPPEAPPAATVASPDPILPDPVLAPPPPEPPAPPLSPPPPPAGDTGPAPRAGAIPRRPLDENLMAILREEAEREAAARRAEGTAIEMRGEMPPDPVLPPVAPPAAVPPAAVPPATVPPAPVAPVQPQRVPPPRRTEPRRVPDFSDLNSVEADDPLADPAGTPDPETPDSPERAQRRPRLPDIEEINSSLRASADRADDIAAQGVLQARQDRGAGFRLGFSMVLLLSALALLVYVYAPQLAGRVPALTPLLDSYVAAVDAARIWLDAQMRAAIAAMQAKTPQT